MLVLVLVIGIAASASSPVDGFVSRLAGLDAAITDEGLSSLIDPDSGLTIDVAAEGSKTPSWVSVKRTSKPEEIRKALLPVISSGAFKATPYCKTNGATTTCTFMTTASLPRVCTIVERKTGFFLSRMEWQGAPKEPESDGDDDLPM